jgi:hypothetical protein
MSNSSFTTKHYVKIGTQLCASIKDNNLTGTTGQKAVAGIVKGLINLFKEDNNKFKENKFLDFLEENSNPSDRIIKQVRKLV